MKNYGIGFSCSFQGVNYHFGHADVASVGLTVTDDNRLHIRSAASDIGQGLESMLIAVVSAHMGGFPVDRILWEGSNTNSPEAGGTGASRQSTLTGNAALQACEKLKGLLSLVAAEYLDTSPDNVQFKGQLLLGGTHSVQIEEIFNEARRGGIQLNVIGKFQSPLTTSIDENGKSQLPISQFGYAVHVAEVEVDTVTGEVIVTRIRAFHDAGTILNGVGARGQVEGAVVMGMGFALSEDFLLDHGLPVNVGFTNYIIPSIADSPEIQVEFLNLPSPIGTLGVKGLAEIPTAAVVPAIINAIFDAIGVRITHLPATPVRIWEALKGQQS